MRLVVSCSTGGIHQLYVDDPMTVYDLKQKLEEMEGVPVAQQLLLFGGRQLQDSLFVQDYNFSDYSLADEVVIHMHECLAKPRRIFLFSHLDRDHQVMQVIEEEETMQGIMQLLVMQGMASEFAPDCPLVVKRSDGTTVQTKILATDTLAVLDAKLFAAEASVSKQLVFNQAADGALHISMHPSEERCRNAYPVYKRSVKPQPLMLVQPAAPHYQTLDRLSKEVCVMP